MRVAVAGGTGLVGRYVVAALERRGHDPIVLARSEGVDLVSGIGLRTALEGVQAVVDVSNRETLNRHRAHSFFSGATTRLLDAGLRAGVQHHVVLSIVGVDRVPSGYYSAKLRQEELVRAGEVPSTVLRATQFHEFAGQLLGRVPGPVAVLPRMRVQPVAAVEVGERLAELAVGPPRAELLQVAGPEVHELTDLARRVAGGRRVLAVRPPGRVGRAMAGGALLPQGATDLGTTTFDDWFAARQVS